MEKINFRNEILGLRALAILPVVFFHLNYKYFVGGFIGVDIFFVISGYLITSIIFNNLGNFNIFFFYERRIRRILPPLLIVCLASIPFAYYLLLPKNYESFAESLILTPLFLSNFIFWINEGYWELSSQMKPLLHTWSLAVEGQFYIFFPLIFFLKNKKKIIFLIITLWIVSFLITINDQSRFLTFTTDKVHSISNFYLPFGRLWEFLSGSLVFLVEKKIIFKNSKINNLLASIGLVLLTLSIFNINYSPEYPNFITLLPVLGTMLLLIYVQKNFIIYKILNSKVLKHFGNISYSLYLWHFPIIVYKKYITNLEFSLVADLVSLFLAYFLSLLSFNLVEKPFYKKNYLKNKYFLTLISLIILLIISIGFFIKNNNGNSAYTQNKLLILKEKFLNYDNYFSLKNKETDVDLNFIGDENLKKIIIIGDSHARDMVRVLKIYNNNLKLEENIVKYDFAFIEFSNLKFNTNDSLFKKIKSAHLVLLSRQFTSERNQFKKIIELIEFSKKHDIKFGIIGSAPEFYTSEDDLMLTFLLQDQRNLNHLINKNTKKINNYFYQNLKTYIINTNIKLKEISKKHEIIFLDRFDFSCDIKNKECFGVNDEAKKLFMDYSHFTNQGYYYFANKIRKINWLSKLN